jgi:sorbose reductase
MQSLSPDNNSITAAGVCPDQPFLQRKPEDVKRCLDINVLGTYFTAQLTAERIVEQEKQKVSPQNNFAAGVPQSAGSIVLIASVAAHQASKGQYVSDYAASKGAVLSLTKELGVELAPHGIRVNCISPGSVSGHPIRYSMRSNSNIVTL